TVGGRTGRRGLGHGARPPRQRVTGSWNRGAGGPRSWRVVYRRDGGTARENRSEMFTRTATSPSVAQRLRRGGGERGGGGLGGGRLAAVAGAAPPGVAEQEGDHQQDHHEGTAQPAGQSGGRGLVEVLAADAGQPAAAGGGAVELAHGRGHAPHLPAGRGV